MGEMWIYTCELNVYSRSRGWRGPVVRLPGSAWQRSSKRVGRIRVFSSAASS